MAAHDHTPQQRRTAEYLGHALSGGAVESLVQSISSRRAEMARSRALAMAGSSAAVTTVAAAAGRGRLVDADAGRLLDVGMSGVQERTGAEGVGMDIGAFVKGAVMRVSWPVILLLRLLWTLTTSLSTTLLTLLTTTHHLLTTWLPSLLPLALFSHALFYTLQGLAFRPAFPTLHRRVWYEDFDPSYSLPRGVLGWVVSTVCTIIISPLRVGWAVLRTAWAVLEGRERWRRGWRGVGRAVGSLRETGEGVWLEVRFNGFMDRLRRWHWVGTAWFARHGVRLSLLVFAVALGLPYLLSHSTASFFPNDGPQVLQFESVKEMGLYFGIPSRFFAVGREVGNSSHYRAEEWGGLGDGGLAETMVVDGVVPEVEMEGFERKWMEGMAGEGDEGGESAYGVWQTGDEIAGSDAEVDASEGEERPAGFRDEIVESGSNAVESEMIETRDPEDVDEVREETEEEETARVEEEIVESAPSVSETKTPRPRALRRRNGGPGGWKGDEWVGYCRKCRQRHCCETVEADEADFLSTDDDGIV